MGDFECACTFPTVDEAEAAGKALVSYNIEYKVVTRGKKPHEYVASERVELRVRASHLKRARWVLLPM